MNGNAEREKSPVFREYVRRVQGGWTDIRLHLPYLFETALEYPEFRLLELGTRDGNSTSAFLAAADEVNGKVWSVDIDDLSIEDKIISLFSATKKWEFKKTNDLAIRTEIPFDIIFIDTSHDLYHTILELRHFGQMVKPGGRILLHDTEWLGLDSPSAQYMFASKGWGPVAWALDWYCDWEHRDQGFTWTNRPGSYGLGEIIFPGKQDHGIIQYGEVPDAIDSQEPGE